jgi:hypothetical protein
LIFINNHSAESLSGQTLFKLRGNVKNMRELRSLKMTR